MSLRQIDDAHETVNNGMAPTTNQALLASNSEPAVLQGLNQQLGQESKGAGNGS